MSTRILSLGLTIIHHGSLDTTKRISLMGAPLDVIFAMRFNNVSLRKASS